MPNVELEGFSRPSPWRKMSMSVWRHPADPQVYGRKEVDMSKALLYARTESERTGTRITPTDLVIRAIALALRKYPDANVLIRWRRIYRRRRVNVFSQVAIPGRKADLSGTIIRDADQKSPAEIASEVRENAVEVMRGRDGDFARIRKSMTHVPPLLYRTVMACIGFLHYTLNWNLGLLGVPKDPFGGAMVTCLGSLGISEGFAPLTPMSRVPVLVSVGKVEDRPLVIDGQVVARPVCVLCTTFDHRVMDGFMAGKVARFVERYMADPEECEKRSRLLCQSNR